ncbi:hypothetical protein ZIOFF_038186 [Zingiber officinale]|uniref:Protein FAR1-RELATED SEQUENCE n=1 Tax=Zingiber officinale TaxID=94328 RepID=A0A8J5GH47_ZINOF|nr:hypothetical protein ZIOFF_038186 [Zingiber officinale]
MMREVKRQGNMGLKWMVGLSRAVGGEASLLSNSRKFYSMKSDKKTFVAPAIVFTPLKPVTSAHGSSGGHPTTLQPLLHTWTRPVVLLSPATPWAAQPPIPSASEISSMQNNCQKAKVMDMASTDSMQVGDGSNVRWVPRIDMLFDSENDAYEFYNAYAENVGFIVRRSTLWTSKNIITRRTFVCSREGFREKKKGAKEAKCPRPETRIGCPACMTIRLTPSGKYRVTEFAPNHNHQIATVSTIHTLRAKKLRRKARVARADLTDDTVTTPEFETEDDAYEFYNMYAGRLGFSVRRASVTVNAENAITRRMFVCSREGFREQKKGAKRVKKPRPEFRTGCPACMVIRITPSGKYQVTEFVTYHNHQLEASLSTENLISQTADNGLDRAAEMADESAENADNKQKYLTAETDLLSFFENYEKILSEKRSAELQADFSASLNTKKSPSMRMLKQAANAYTPAAYRMFEREFESYMDCMLYSLGEVGTISQYNVIVDEKPKEHLVKFDSVDGSATCSCKKFEFLGIQCCHVLKVLDTRNIKEIPSQYILKRWRKDAKNSELSQNLALSFGDPQSSVTNRCNILCRIFGLAAAHAAKSLDSYAFLEGQAELLNNQIEQFLQTRSVETTSVISAPSDRLQNPVESGVPESLQISRFQTVSPNHVLGAILIRATRIVTIRSHGVFY